MNINIASDFYVQKLLKNERRIEIISNGWNLKLEKDVWGKRKMKKIKFYNRLRNQYLIHRRWASTWTIVKIAWAQSKNKKIEMVGVVVDRSVIPMTNIDIDKEFDNSIKDAQDSRRVDDKSTTRLRSRLDTPHRYANEGCMTKIDP